MAKDKKSFVLYTDLIHTIEKMKDESAGKLFKHLLRYVNDLNPECESELIAIAFEPIKQQLKRDLKKYEQIREKRSEAGKLGGRPKQEEANKANAFFDKQTKAKKAVSVNVNVNDSDSVNDNENERTFKSIHSLEKELMKTQWLETIGRNKGTTPQVIQRMFKDFIKILENRGENFKEEKDFKKHFANWMDKQQLPTQTGQVYTENKKKAKTEPDKYPRKDNFKALEGKPELILKYIADLQEEGWESENENSWEGEWVNKTFNLKIKI